MKRTLSQFCLIVIAFAYALSPGWASAQEATTADFFETKIRPLLVEKCHFCHGDKEPKGSLSLTSRAAMLVGGDSGPAAVPGSSSESLLMEAISYESEPRMPPKKPLTTSEIEALAHWVDLGLPWPASGEPAANTKANTNTGPPDSNKHWAFQPLQPLPRPPQVQSKQWLRTPVDSYILKKLEDAGLSPSPTADQRTLVRRLWHDVTGLPPTPDQLDEALADKEPLAYERLVDRLLASPQYGEHLARQWLDLARYSDTKGYVYAREESSWVHAWAYRDWVVKALNDDMPYDRFVLLQMVADQISDDPEDLRAMGFLTLGRRFLGVTHDIINDRIDVVTRGTLGLTVACARCHDHKYDPIPTSDYYSLYGVFKNCEEKLVPAFSADDRPQPNDPFVLGLAERESKLRQSLATERAATGKRARERVEDYLLAQFELNKYPEEGFDQILSADDIIPATVRRWRDYLSRAEQARNPVFVPWHAFLHISQEDFDENALTLSRELSSLNSAEINSLVARAFETPLRSPSDVAARYGSLFSKVDKQWQEALEQASCDGRPLPDGLPDPEAEALRQVLYGPDSPCSVPDESIANIESYFPSSTCESLWRLQGDVDRYLIQTPEAPAHALILADRATTTNAHVFRRGSPANLGDQVPAHFLEILAGKDPPPFQKGSGRLELARAIIDPANPLTARVQANRLWMHYFGAGLVDTPGDFGTRAEPPSHPELLDWLAARFIADGWSLKRLSRLILLSAAYRQAATGPVDPSQQQRALQLDPGNRWLWHHRPRRRTFEETRDALLVATGNADLQMGGKPAPLLTPPFSRRRTLYGRVDRQDLPSVFRAFDFANPDLLIPQRSETTVPQQALFFLNHPFVIESAKTLAALPEISSLSDSREKIIRLYRRVLLRDPTETQLNAAMSLVDAASVEPALVLSSTAPDWHYGFGRFDEASGTVADFQPLPHFNGEAWQGGPSWPDPSLGWVQLTAQGGHAGNDQNHAAVRRWVAPRNMNLRIRSTLVHDTTQGDGVRGFLVLTAKHATVRAEVHNSRAQLDLEVAQVQAGDIIDFVVDLRDNLNNDQFDWAPIIEEVGPASATTWKASSDFAGKPPLRLDPWEQLAQVLLMSNEFCFVD